MIEHKHFEGVDFNEVKLEHAYYGCRFMACNFTQVQLAGVEFEACEFLGCNFAMCCMAVTLCDVSFIECKLMGSDFSHLNPFSSGITFRKSQLDFASFEKAKLRRARFDECRLYESNFTLADVSQAHFKACNLERALFHNTNLSGANLTSAYNFSIDPSQNKLKGACFSEAGLHGLVECFGVKGE